MPTTADPLVFPAFLQRRLDAALAELFQPQGRPPEDFSQPAGEPALIAADSLSWQVFKNPVVMFIGGVAAVIMELAEPRVRSGVWEHSRFREQPMERLRRTALATVMTVYGPRSRTEAMIAQVRQLHERVSGLTPRGTPYHANDVELLDWVQATAAFGFLQAHHQYVRPLAREDQDRFYAEGAPAARLYGAAGAPRSAAELEALFERMQPQLEPSEIVHEFLHIVAHMPAVASPLRPLQSMLLRAAVQTVPTWLRERLGLERAWALPAWQRVLVRALARTADRMLIGSGAAVNSCRRLGLPDNHLYSRKPPSGR